MPERQGNFGIFAAFPNSFPEAPHLPSLKIEPSCQTFVIDFLSLYKVERFFTNSYFVKGVGDVKIGEWTSNVEPIYSSLDFRIRSIQVKSFNRTQGNP